MENVWSLRILCYEFCDAALCLSIPLNFRHNVSLSQPLHCGVLSPRCFPQNWSHLGPGTTHISYDGVESSRVVCHCAPSTQRWCGFKAAPHTHIQTRKVLGKFTYISPSLWIIWLIRHRLCYVSLCVLYCDIKIEQYCVLYDTDADCGPTLAQHICSAVKLGEACPDFWSFPFFLGFSVCRWGPRTKPVVHWTQTSPAHCGHTALRSRHWPAPEPSFSQ